MDKNPLGSILARKDSIRFTKKSTFAIVLTVSILLSGFFVAAPQALATIVAPSQGPNSGSNFTDDSTVGSYVWSNPGNAQTSNDSYATTSIASSSNRTHYLRASGFGFNIPTGSTINGIQLQIERHQSCTGTGCTSTTTDNTVSLIKSGVIGTTNKATTTAWSLTDSIATYGGSTDLWGTTWAVADINSTSTGAVLSVGRTSGRARTVYVDYISMTVYYTPPPPSIMTTSPLPNGKVNNVYSQTLTATSGTPSYTWSITSGN